MGGWSILDSRTLTSSEGIVAGLLRAQFAGSDDNSAVRVTAAPQVGAAHVDAWTPIGVVQYAMLSGSTAAFTVNASLAGALSFASSFFYVQFKDADGTPRDAALDFTGPLGLYLNGGDAEGLYQGIRNELRKANLTGGTYFIGAPEASALGDVADSGSITVNVGQALAAALGLPAGATLEAIGKAFVELQRDGSTYTPGSAVVMTEFELLKSGAQNQLRAASNAGNLLAFSDNAAPTIGVWGFFPATGFSPECSSTLQGANGDVGACLDGLSSDQAYNKFMAIAATISNIQL
jgi:hypothetical protein